MQRRTFIKRTSGALLAAPWIWTAGSQPAVAQSGHMFKKAVKFGMIQEDNTVLEKFNLLRSLGYDGVELDSPSNLDEKEVIDAKNASGLPIHGVVDSVHWRQTLSHPDPAVRDEGRAGLEHALRQAKAYGASTVLLVPAVVNDEVSYADAYARSQAEIRKVLPLARETGVKIALENVWNYFLLSPLEYARYIDEFESDWIGAYFDIGNIVNYSWPQHWIRTLGSRILKLDVKEFSRQKRDDDGLWQGFRVEIGDGDNNWPAVRKALSDISYSGWATAEVSGGDTERLKEILRRMEAVLPG